mmetsp:Transcript_25227/g.86396  ORF Transcript_25227/g.86396 Transcript_25227/m.86396 type:complete len:298 (-) Transcript_25227:446-1339(-)
MPCEASPSAISSFDMFAVTLGDLALPTDSSSSTSAYSKSPVYSTSSIISSAGASSLSVCVSISTALSSESVCILTVRTARVVAMAFTIVSVISLSCASPSCRSSLVRASVTAFSLLCCSSWSCRILSACSCAFCCISTTRAKEALSCCAIAKARACSTAAISALTSSSSSSISNPACSRCSSSAGDKRGTSGALGSCCACAAVCWGGLTCSSSKLSSVACIGGGADVIVATIGAWCTGTGSMCTAGISMPVLLAVEVGSALRTSSTGAAGSNNGRGSGASCVVDEAASASFATCCAT